MMTIRVEEFEIAKAFRDREKHVSYIRKVNCETDNTVSSIITIISMFHQESTVSSIGNYCNFREIS